MDKPSRLTGSTNCGPKRTREEDLSAENAKRPRLAQSESQPEWHKFTQLVVNGELRPDRKLNPKEVQELADWLATSPPELLPLDLRNSDIGNAGAAVLAIALKTNSTLTRLDLGENHISKNGAATLAEVLITNPTLTTLDLWGNNIGKNGAASLAAALKTNSTLTTLKLAGNNIGKSGATSLAEALKANSTLTTLDLRANEIGKSGGTSLAEALKTNSTLTTLDLDGNFVDPKHREEIKARLQRNKQLPEKMNGAAAALGLASGYEPKTGFQYPPEIMDLIVQQLVALPHELREGGISTIEQLSNSIGHPPPEPDSPSGSESEMDSSEEMEDDDQGSEFQ